MKITLLEAENKYDRSSNLNFILLLFIPKKYFLTEPQKYWEKSCLESFIQGEANDSFVAKTYVNAINFFFFLMLKLVLMTTPALCICRIKQVPARLWYNFFHLNSLEAPQNLKTVEESRTKVEFDHRRVKNKYTGLL